MAQAIPAVLVPSAPQPSAPLPSPRTSAAFYSQNIYSQGSFPRVEHPTTAPSHYQTAAAALPAAPLQPLRPIAPPVQAAQIPATPQFVSYAPPVFQATQAVPHVPMHPPMPQYAQPLYAPPAYAQLPTPHYFQPMAYPMVPIGYMPVFVPIEMPPPPYGAPRAVPTNKEVQIYTDNWNWTPQSTAVLPGGSSGILAFGVVNPDASFDPNYPVDDPSQHQWGPFYPRCKTLSIGGWNNSQAVPGPNPWEQNNGLYKVMTSKDQGVRDRFIANLVQTVRANGYSELVIDYENYQDPPPDPALYTNFLIQLEAALKQLNPQQPPVLKIAISPWAHNQRFYNIQTLIARTDIKFQVMCYDYAMGQSNANHRFYNNYHPAQTNQPSRLLTILGIIFWPIALLYALLFPLVLLHRKLTSNSIQVLANASVTQTYTYLTQLAQANVPLERVMVGVPAYGLAYNVSRSLTPDQVKQKLSDGTLTATSYWNGDGNAGNGQVRNDTIENWIRDWDNPQNGWIRLQNGESLRETFYYNPAQGVIVSAMPPSQIDVLKAMIEGHFPKAKDKWFIWEGQNDIQGKVASRLLVDTPQSVS